MNSAFHIRGTGQVRDRVHLAGQQAKIRFNRTQSDLIQVNPSGSESRKLLSLALLT